MPRKEVLIIEVNDPAGNLNKIIDSVSQQTGADKGSMMLCPKIAEGQPYSGHVHVVVPGSAVNASEQPIKL